MSWGESYDPWAQYVSLCTEDKPSLVPLEILYKSWVLVFRLNHNFVKKFIVFFASILL